MQPRPISLRGLCPSRVSRLAGLPLLGALLALGLAAPAHAMSGTINYSYSGSYPIVVNPGETLTITTGGSVTAPLRSDAIHVEGGTVNVIGGSVGTSNGVAIHVGSGTLSISGGSVGSFDTAVWVDSGAVSISGGSISDGHYGVAVLGGSATISGTCLRLDAYGNLTGTLADGTSISTLTYGLTASDLITTCPDTSAPATTASATSGGNPYSAGTWTNQDVTVSLKATDPDDTSTSSDVKQITYSFSGAQSQSSTDTTLNPVTLPNITAEGSTTVSFHATDKAGNVESPDKTFVVNIDRTAPKTTATPSGPLGSNGWYTGPVSVTLSASDANGDLAVSGVKQTLFSVDNGSPVDYASLPPGGIPITTDRTHTLTFYSIDGAGNIEDKTNASNTLTVKIDGIAPTSSASATQGSAAAPYNSGTWTKQNVTVTLSAIDNAGGSGVQTISYSLNGGASWATINSASVPLEPFDYEGKTTILYYAVDNAGNKESPVHSFTVQIDQTAPTVSFLTPTAVPNANGWYNTNVSIPFTASDNLSGVASTNPASSPLVLSTEGSAVSGMVTATDNAGNSASYSSPTVKIDKTPPAITGSRLPAANAYGWNNTAVTVHFASSDALSGVQSSTPDTTLSGEGANQSVTGTAIDFAGNQASATVSPINIDLTPPVVTYSGNAGPYTVDQMVSITCSASDNLSGVASSTCQNISGLGYSFNLGLNSFSASATDKAGNTGSGSTSFTVQDTTGGIGHLVTLWVSDPAVVQGLLDKLNAIAQGNGNAKAGAVGAFIDQVQAQTGKSITAAHAAILIRLVSAL